MNQLEAEIKNLELALLHADVRKHPDLLNDLLDSDFEEINSAGYIVSRTEAVNWLTNKKADCYWELENFRLRRLADDTVLAMYQLRKAEAGSAVSSLRSSIWQRKNKGWTMLFHQGTKIKSL